MDEMPINSPGISKSSRINDTAFISRIQPSKNVKQLLSYDLLVFCHLRWNFVYQRPQHIISRLSKKYSILLIEEPIHFDEEEKFGYELEEISANLQVLKPKVDSIVEIPKVLEKLPINKTVSIGWFYSAAFSGLISYFKFDTIVYDCVDELSLFKGASKDLVHQEKYLLSKADIVFTGGRALYESKKKAHSKVYCFPSSVDRKHFEKANFDIPIPNDIKNISRPIVGYFGVIDERINLDLLQATAQKLPNVSFVMIGPLAKIGEEDLPREENIHFLGMKSYNQLPHYLKAFDIAMMPFALNDATKFISPTKTLEYMAAGVPIISTAIKDVVRDYKNCVYIIDSMEDFIDSIKELLFTKTDGKVKKFDVILAKTSWDTTVDKMSSLIEILEA